MKIVDDVWQTSNGVLGILGLFLAAIVVSYLVRNIHKTYGEPVRFITAAFFLIIVGHTIKDSSGYFMRAWDVVPRDWIILSSLVMIAAGKIGCILTWSDPQWGNKPWIIAAALVVAFLAFDHLQQH